MEDDYSLKRFWGHYVLQRQSHDKSSASEPAIILSKLFWLEQHVRKGWKCWRRWIWDLAGCSLIEEY